MSRDLVGGKGFPQIPLYWSRRGAGEAVSAAIAMEEPPAGPRVKMYHCKASSEPQPGNCVEDLYEVCGQAVKSNIWIGTDHSLVAGTA
jgi:hypothetical protein